MCWRQPRGVTAAAGPEFVDVARRARGVCGSPRACCVSVQSCACSVGRRRSADAAREQAIAA
eukprot:7958519-Lingulodinium_polyedra.AAC.1